MTIVTTVLLGLIYPLAMSAVSQTLFGDKANGQLIVREGQVVGSRIIGQPFTGAGYFHSRPSAAGSGYDGANSGGTNLGPTNQKLIERVKQVASLHRESPNSPVLIDLVTTSASGLDPDITPAAAYFQVPRVARERHLDEDQVKALVQAQVKPRPFGIVGEPRVNVLELNLALNRMTGR